MGNGTLVRKQELCGADSFLDGRARAGGEVGIEVLIPVELNADVIVPDTEAQPASRPDYRATAGVANGRVEQEAEAEIGLRKRKAYNLAREFSLRVNSNLELMELARQQILQAVAEICSKRLDRGLKRSEGSVVLDMYIGPAEPELVFAVNVVC